MTIARIPHGVGLQPLNPIVNGDLAIWQAAQTYTSAGVVSSNVAPDMFWNIFQAANYTVSRQSGGGTIPYPYCMRLQRNAGNTNTGTNSFGYDFLTPDGRKLANRQWCLSFLARVGANWSAPNVTFFRSYGTGTDQSRRLVVLTGEVAAQTTFVPTTSWIRYSFPWYVGSANEACLMWMWAHTGTAGADDYLEVTGIQIDEGTAPGYSQITDHTLELARCQRRYWKTFPIETPPAQNSGITTGLYRMAAPTAGATTQRGPAYPFPVPMRASPTVTTYNPSAANAQLRDTTAGVDCSGTTTQQNESSVIVLATGNAGTAVGNSLACHLTADARI